MLKIKKLHVLSKKPLRSDLPYTPIFSKRTKYLLFTGLIIIILSSFYLLNQTIQLMYFVPTIPPPPVSTNARKIFPVPIAMSVTDLAINLPVAQTGISGGVWSIAKDGVSHLNASANPEETGPGIYYAHNTRNKFGPIRWIKKGATITITTLDLKKHTYTVTETVKTDPKELSVFFTRKQEAIYLFTCDGFGDLQRFVVIAEPEIASPSASQIPSE